MLEDESVVVLKTRWESPAAAGQWAQAYSETVPLRYSDPVRYSGRTDLLVAEDLGQGRRTWEMPGERGALFRDTEEGNKLRGRLERLVKESAQRCPLVKHIEAPKKVSE